MLKVMQNNYPLESMRGTSELFGAKLRQDLTFNLWISAKRNM